LSGRSVEAVIDGMSFIECGVSVSTSNLNLNAYQDVPFQVVITSRPLVIVPVVPIRFRLLERIDGTDRESALIGVMCVSAGVLFFTTGCLGFTLYYRKTRILKSASIPFLLTFIFGNGLRLMTPFFSAPYPPTAISCNLLPWFEHISYCIIFGRYFLWFCGVVVLWCCGFLVLWSCRLVVLSSCGLVVLWSCGLVVLWFFGLVVLWLCICSFVFRNMYRIVDCQELAYPQNLW